MSLLLDNTFNVYENYVEAALSTGNEAMPRDEWERLGFLFTTGITFKNCVIE